jgi:hypothetical protein
MKSIFTTTNRRYSEFSLFLFIVLFPFAAQSQNTNSDLELRMQALYDRAAQLYANLPNRDFRGNYLSLSLGISPAGHIEKWRIEEVCDCEGNVVETRQVTSDKAPISLGIGLERRITNAFSVRFMGNYATLSHGKGNNVMAANGTFAQMQQDYKLSQYGLHGSAMLYHKSFYGGAGASYTTSQASGFKTNAQKSETKPVEYFNLKAQVLKTHQTEYTPHIFVGYRAMLSPFVSTSIEAGVSQSYYVNFQLNFTLLSKTRASLTDWKSAHAHYKSVFLNAVALDMSLHPAKFQSSDCTIIDSGSSNNNCRN